ncbi:Tat (twin-arginine translocation) pathway signal sequence [Bradyrhizobium erythrophlei]|jgi:hypothetical protein|nr:Tat (twin-arginine translocation) pathway signal sequence [Bradyrhizobium erythrophlei]
MTQADGVHSTPPTNTLVDPTRRRFISHATALAAALTVSQHERPLPRSTRSLLPSTSTEKPMRPTWRRSTNSPALRGSMACTMLTGASRKSLAMTRTTHLRPSSEPPLPRFRVSLPSWRRELGEQNAWMFDEREGTALRLAMWSPRGSSGILLAARRRDPVRAMRVAFGASATWRRSRAVAATPRTFARHLRR